MTPSPTPEPAWLTAMETQDPKDLYFKVVAGQPVITLYGDNQTATSIFLSKESVQIITTTDSLHPNLLTAKDAGGNIYLFNENRRAWFTFFKGFAPRLEQFVWVDKSDIPVIIDYFRSQPPLVSADAPTAKPLPRMSSPDGSGSFDLHVTDEGSCVGAASIKIQYQGGEPYFVIWQVKMKNGMPGYLLGYIYDPTEFNTLGDSDGKYALGYTPPDEMIFRTGQSSKYRSKYPYYEYIFNQPGYLDAIDKYIATGIIPPELEKIILFETN